MCHVSRSKSIFRITIRHEAVKEDLKTGQKANALNGNDKVLM